MNDLKYLLNRLDIAKKIIIAEDSIKQNSFLYQLEYGGDLFTGSINDYFTFEKRAKLINTGVYMLDNYYVGKANKLTNRAAGHLQELFTFLKTGYKSYNINKDLKLLINIVKGKKTNVKLLSRFQEDEEKLIKKHARTLTNKQYNRYYNFGLKKYKYKLF